jgi:hypothetical protein
MTSGKCNITVSKSITWKICEYRSRIKMENLKNIIDMEAASIHEFSKMDEIRKLEEKYNITLPNNYAQFLLEYGGKFTEDDYWYRPLEPSPLTTEDGYDLADYFLGNEIIEIIENSDIYKAELEGKLLPIAKAGGGDYICIGIKDNYYGKIYSWIHDDGWTDDLKDRVYLIANTFEEFIASFVKYVRPTRG